MSQTFFTDKNRDASDSKLWIKTEHQYSGFTHWKLWFSIVFCMFTRGYLFVDNIHHKKFLPCVAMAWPPWASLLWSRNASSPHRCAQHAAVCAAARRSGQRRLGRRQAESAGGCQQPRDVVNDVQNGRKKGRWHRQGGVLIWIFRGESESSLLGDAECTLLEDANMGWDRPTMRHGSGVDVLSHPQTCFCHWVENRSCSRPGGLFFGIASFKQICFTKTLVPRTWKASEVYPPKPY